MGVFFWGWQLVRSYSPKYSLHRPEYPRAAGKFSNEYWCSILIGIYLESSSLPLKKIHNDPYGNFRRCRYWDDQYLFARHVVLLGS